ncbi:MAG: ATP-binding protein [Acidobacteriota bacterium]|nr:MAG: ATP-binding protein [Acidobacteriota bacterium]
MQRTFELASRPDAIAPALDAIESGLADVRVAQELALELRLITEEVITNVVKYAEADTIRIDFKVSDITIILEVRDDGKAFDPLRTTAPDLEASVEDRRLGGLGIHLVQALADELSYERRGGWNVLRLTKER